MGENNKTRLDKDKIQVVYWIRLIIGTSNQGKSDTPDGPRRLIAL